MSEHVPETSATVDDAQASAPRCACCGAALPARVPVLILTGRPRRTCSTSCRRRLQRVRRLIDRRRAWMALWVAQRGLVPDAEVTDALDALEQDIAEARAMLRR